MTTTPFRRWAGLLLGLAGVLLTGCTMAGARGATISTIARTSSGDCPPATVIGTAPGLDSAQEVNATTVVGVALGRGLGGTGAAIAVAAALAESSLYNYVTTAPAPSSDPPKAGNSTTPKGPSPVNH